LVAPKWHDHNARDNPPFLDALAKAQDIAVMEGWCTSTSRRSSWRSTNTPRRLQVIGNISRIHRTQLVVVGRPETFPRGIDERQKSA
jgi:hypothetical protein